MLATIRDREQPVGADELEQPAGRDWRHFSQVTLPWIGAIAILGMLAVLVLFPLYFLRSFAYAGVGVVVIAALGALLVLPALLTVLGRRGNAGRPPWAKKTSPASPVWGRPAGRGVRRAAAVSTRLRRKGLAARTARLKARYAGFRTIARSVTMQNATNFSMTIAELFTAWS